MRQTMPTSPPSDFAAASAGIAPGAIVRKPPFRFHHSATRGEYTMLLDLDGQAVTVSTPLAARLGTTQAAMLGTGWTAHLCCRPAAPLMAGLMRLSPVGSTDCVLMVVQPFDRLDGSPGGYLAIAQRFALAVSRDDDAEKASTG